MTGRGMLIGQMSFELRRWGFSRASSGRFGPHLRCVSFHATAVVSALFGDPNFVPCAGLVPVMRLAELVHRRGAACSVAGRRGCECWCGGCLGCGGHGDWWRLD